MHVQVVFYGVIILAIAVICIITLRLLNDSCTFPGAKRFVITGTVPGENRTKNATDGINIPKLVWNAIYCYSSVNVENIFSVES
jgi:hypothetical protein